MVIWEIQVFFHPFQKDRKASNKGEPPRPTFFRVIMLAAGRDQLVAGKALPPSVSCSTSQSSLSHLMAPSLNLIESRQCWIIAPRVT